MTETTVTTSSDDIEVHGHCKPGFERLREAFETGFQLGEEVGASVSLVVDGETVVDLWGGYKDREKTQKWDEDTIVCCMSSSKGISAISIAMAIDRGLLDLDEPVATYWPEFAQNGKEELPLRYILDHRAGLPYVEELPQGTMDDFDANAAQLARQKPLWEPGTVACYHVQSQGYLLGEILRRVTGKKIGEFFRSEVSEQLGVDFHIGLTDEEQERCAEFIVAPEVFAARGTTPPTLLTRGWDQMPEGDMQDILNSRQWREADVSSASGHGNGRALARVWGAVARGGEMNGVRLFSPETAELLGTQQHEEVEVRAGRRYRQGLGVTLSGGPIMNYGPNPNAFGHGGVGGSLGFADPDLKAGFGYSPNNMNSTPDSGPRVARLVTALYESLGWK